MRVLLTAALGYLCAIPLPRWLGIDARWGMAGLTASTGVAGWVEFALLRRKLNQRLGRSGIPAFLTAKLWISATVAASAAWAVKLTIGRHGPVLSAAAVLGAYGMIYFAATYVLRVEECRLTIKRFIR